MRVVHWGFEKWVKLYSHHLLSYDFRAHPVRWTASSVPCLLGFTQLGTKPKVWYFDCAVFTDQYIITLQTPESCYTYNYNFTWFVSESSRLDTSMIRTILSKPVITISPWFEPYFVVIYMYMYDIIKTLLASQSRRRWRKGCRARKCIMQYG